MGSIDDISQLCRLCLVKDQVNIPIFDGTSDIGQTFIKIESCLPVKVSRNDNLPKKICDGCSYKLDMLYTFRNTSIDSEKQLIQWLNQAGLSTISQTTTVKDPLASTTKPEIMVKQENFDTTDSRVDGDNPDLVDPQSFMIQQDHLGYEQEFVDFGEASGSNANDDSLTDEPAPKRAKRAAALKKAPLDDETEDDLDAAMQITKAEEEDEEEVDQPEYVEAPSTSADDQPGPSGVGKATTEAPSMLETLLTDPFACPKCPKMYPTKRKLQKHLLYHKDPIYHCTLCPKSFKMQSLLRKHIAATHQGKQWTCMDCDYITNTRNNLRSHVICVHTKDFPYKCDLCSAGYLTKTLLINHKRIKHDNQFFICEFCKKIYKDKNHFKHHMKNHTSDVKKEFECELCFRQFDLGSQMRTHIKNVHGDKSLKVFICEICGKRLSKEGLVLHKKRHNGEKKHCCDHCGKAFITKQNLIVHLRIHSEEKPYKCEECGKRFTQNSSLVVHSRLHTGERPFNCEICTKRFLSKSALKNHKCKGYEND